MLTDVEYQYSISSELEYLFKINFRPFFTCISQVGWLGQHNAPGLAIDTQPLSPMRSESNIPKSNLIYVLSSITYFVYTTLIHIQIQKSISGKLKICLVTMGGYLLPTSVIAVKHKIKHSDPLISALV